MKLLVVSNMFPSKEAPAFGVFVERISTQMAQGGFDLNYAVRFQRENENKLIGYLKFYKAAFIKSLCNVSGVYVHFATHSAPPVLIARLFKKFPFVVHVHGADLAPERGGVVKKAVLFWMAKKVLMKADLIVAPSLYFKEFAIKKFAVSPDKIIVSPSGGVDIKRFSFPPKILLDNTKKHLLFLGRLIPGKGVMTVIPCAARLAARYPEQRIEVVIAGDGPLMPELKVQSHMVPTNVVVRLVGAVAPDRVPVLMEECSVLLFPSYRLGESLGLVAIEGMACGKPVVAARNGAMSDVIKNGVNGFLFDADIESSMDRAVEQILFAEQADYMEMCHQARLTAEGFSGDVVGDELNNKLKLFLEKFIF